MSHSTLLVTCHRWQVEGVSLAGGRVAGAGGCGSAGPCMGEQQGWGCASRPGVPSALMPSSSLRAQRPTLPSFPAPHTLTSPASAQSGGRPFKKLGQFASGPSAHQTQDRPHFPHSIRQSLPGQYYVIMNASQFMWASTPWKVYSELTRSLCLCSNIGGSLSA